MERADQGHIEADCEWGSRKTAAGASFYGASQASAACFLPRRALYGLSRVDPC